MRHFKSILGGIILVASLYFLLFFILTKIKYKNRPLVYVTNDYYSWKGGDSYYRYREFNKDSTYDILFAGSSRAYRGYSPYEFEKYGITSFNLGSSAQTIKNTYFVAKEYVTKQNCELLVIDVFAGAFVHQTLESTSDLIENSSTPSVAYEIALNNFEISVLNMTTLRFFTERDTAYYQKSDYVGKGYSATNDSMPEHKRKQINSKSGPDLSDFQVDEEQLQYFEKLLKMCEEKSIKTVCVYSPCSYFYNFLEHPNFLNKILPVMKEHQVQFVDFSKLPGLSSADHFYDDSHLNQAGVEIFNKAFVNWLKDEKI